MDPIRVKKLKENYYFSNRMTMNFYFPTGKNNKAAERLLIIRIKVTVD